MSHFVVFPYDSDETFAEYSPEEMQEIIARYHAWTQGLAERGKLEMGHKLIDGEGRVVQGSGTDMQVTDGPYSETKEVIGGLWLLRADSYDEAVSLVSDCPHLEFGRLEIREVDQ